LRAGHAVRRLAGEPTEPQPTHRQVDHHFAALGEVRILFTQPALAPNPGDRAFYHPPAWQDGEGRQGRRLDIEGIPAPALGALNNVQGPFALLFHPMAQPLAAIGHVGPDVLQPLARLVGSGQEPGRHIGVPQIGGVDEDTPHETRRLNEEMALAAVELLGAIIAVGPPCSVVFTVCASMMAAEGGG
jgi:hypothetical protein